MKKVEWVKRKSLLGTFILRIVAHIKPFFGSRGRYGRQVRGRLRRDYDTIRFEKETELIKGRSKVLPYLAPGKQRLASARDISSFTSRNPQIARAPLTMSKEIESFSVENGARMLLSGLDSHSPDEEKAAYEITAKLGDLPLAIHHMACFATDRMLSLWDTLKL
ncbi:hypothetical protein GX51_01239 [Blastomyces parvus]|uniref:Uncharacterized protein n=1 Tax=Blastomyces parvus TaxID=2060905 RepID=A0A2B7XI93_9EURO|nr:hypothetical protein GX51_01239 [Blastomyces parvus]